MKSIVCLVLLIFSSYLASEEVKAENWLLWYKKATQLPFSSALTIYPPVNIYTENGRLKGSIAVPYSLNDKIDIDEYLIIVTDAGGTPHFLKPKLKSVGFVNELGISISTFSSNSFQSGNVLIQLYKNNTLANRQKLKERENKNLKKKQGIQNALSNINIPKPVLGEVWQMEASTLDKQHFNTVVTSSTYTIVQLYSPYCGFCKKSIPFNNTLNNSKDINVVGLAGVNNINDFKEHLHTNNVQYPFISYTGEYAESAILEAVGQYGFPTYFVLDSSKKVHGIYVGTLTLENWLKTLSL